MNFGVSANYPDQWPPRSVHVRNPFSNPFICFVHSQESKVFLFSIFYSPPATEFRSLLLPVAIIRDCQPIISVSSFPRERERDASCAVRSGDCEDNQFNLTISSTHKAPLIKPDAQAEVGTSIHIHFNCRRVSVTASVTANKFNAI